MAKGFKLKELLKHKKDQEKSDREELIKQKKTEARSNDDGIVVIDAKSVSKMEQEEEDEDQSSVEEEEYKSQALSKKDKRKLKKQQKKADEDEEDFSVDDNDLKFDRLAQSASEAEEEEDDDEEEEEEEEDVVEEEEEEEDVPLSEVEFDSDADVVPHQKLTVNNTKAMQHSLERIQLPWAKHSFQEHQSITSEVPTDEGIRDIYDDTERELAFYKQSLNAVMTARDHFRRLKVPFKRPLDYFAEMAKSDEHMDRIKGKLVQEASEKKARDDARNQRQLKKFGKQVQNATLQKRQAEKRETLDKIKSLKKKRKQSEIGDTDFDVGIEEATSEPPVKRPNHKRDAKNNKFGKGGLKRFNRKNDAESSMDVSGFSQRKMKGKAPRPGKSKRSRRH